MFLPSSFFHTINCYVQPTPKRIFFDHTNFKLIKFRINPIYSKKLCVLLCNLLTRVALGKRKKSKKNKTS